MPNIAPTANAGPDQGVEEGTTVILDASASSDSDGRITQYFWTQSGGPAVTLSSSSATSPSFTAPAVDSPITLSFTVRVTDDDGAEAVDSVSVEVRPVPSGLRVVPLTHDGKERVYSIYTPPTFTPNSPAVVLLHGGSQSMRSVLEPGTTTSLWLEIADREGLLLLVPNGYSPQREDGLGDRQTWNDLRDDDSGRTSLEDDSGFILAMLTDALTTRRYDRTRVFITGSSNGGMMAMRMLIEAPFDFSGSAAFIAALPEEPVVQITSAPPIMLLNGTEDPLVKFEGGIVSDGGAPTRSVLDTVDYWLRASGASRGNATNALLPNTVPSDDCIIAETQYPASAGTGTAVAYYEARGGGHSIPDPDPPVRDPAVIAALGPQCRDAHGIELAWEFFNRIADR
ncbi:hypothetical protein HFP57_07800 [Parasphingopyxis algicola]|uniref:alpha/beta hydrolase family esterase n=1 Tax=Parasphingopyxis algicola TaxID=2026624 RepID=UPI0015A3BF5C|nr:PKD domain-containing protein [Parasphingopyxis algicola]QLC24940.1 hypothetical protein HFP57_07800 [Parasphingopyxis algicola]